MDEKRRDDVHWSVYGDGSQIRCRQKCKDAGATVVSWMQELTRSLVTELLVGRPLQRAQLARRQVLTIELRKFLQK